MNCPTCHSTRSYFSFNQQTLVCENGHPIAKDYRHPPKELRIVGYTESGGHWYQAPSGSIFLITKDTLKESEHKHINPELSWAHHDFMEEYKYAKIGQKIEERAKAVQYLKSLSPEQIEQLKSQLT